MTRLLLLLTFAIIMTIDTSGQTASKLSDFANNIIFAFKTQDFQRFKSLSLDTSDYKEFINDFIKSNHISAQEQESLKQKEKLFADSADDSYKKEFDRLIAKGNKLSVDWTKIEQAKFVYEADKPVNSTLRSLSGHLNFKCGNKTFVLFGIEALLFNSGYKISEIRTVLDGGVDKYINPDLLDDDDI